MLFTYILSGWEGSATDAQVWADALANGFSVPEGFYYLADVGYPHCKELLVPFHGIHYHLQEWGAAGVWYVPSLMDLIFCYNNSTAQKMQRNYSTFVMLRYTMSLSIFLEFSSNTSGFYFFLLVIPLTFKLVFLLHYVLSRISFKKLTPMKVQYLQIHTNQLTHPCC